MNGIDVSEHQRAFDFTPYKDGFVIIRGGFWTSADPWAERNIAKDVYKRQIETRTNSIPHFPGKCNR